VAAVLLLLLFAELVERQALEDQAEVAQVLADKDQQDRKTLVVAAVVQSVLEAVQIREALVVKG
jgi:hypothetical protein